MEQTGRTNRRGLKLFLGCLAVAGALILTGVIVMAVAGWYFMAPVPIESRDTMLRGDEPAYLSVTARRGDAALVELLRRAFLRSFERASDEGRIDAELVTMAQAIQLQQLLPVRIEMAWFAEDLPGGPSGVLYRVSISSGARAYRMLFDRLLSMEAAEPEAGVSVQEIGGRRMYRFAGGGPEWALTLEDNHVTTGPAQVLEAWLRSRGDAAEGGALPDSIRTMHGQVGADEAMAWGYMTYLPLFLGPLTGIKPVPPSPPLRPREDLELLDSMRFLCAAGELADPDTVKLRAIVLVASRTRPSPADAARIAALLERAITGLSPHLEPSLQVVKIQENLVRIEGTVGGLSAALGL